VSKGSDYINGVLDNLMADESIANTAHRGAFLAAALAIMKEVDSPVKERALVSLAALEIRQEAAIRRKRKAA